MASMEERSRQAVVIGLDSIAYSVNFVRRGTCILLLMHIYQREYHEYHEYVWSIHGTL